MYIVNDLAVNQDTGITSSYIYKNTGDVMRAGPVWDYDKAFANDNRNSEKFRYGYNLRDPQTNFVREGIVYLGGNVLSSEIINSGKTCDHVYNALYDHGDFEALVNKTWNDTFIPNKAALFEYLDEASMVCENDVAANSVLWNTYSAQADAVTSYRADCQKLSSFLEARSEYLSQYYTQDHTAVPHSNMVSSGEPDKPDPPKPSKSFWDKIVDFFRKIFDFFKNMFK